MPDCESIYFDYGETETEWLKKRDKKLGSIIESRGKINRIVHSQAFPALLRAVIGQQISSKAQDAIWSRFLSLCSPPSPEHIAGLDPQQMRQCGISMRKAEYLAAIAREFSEGDLKGVALETLSDDDLREKLSGLRGVGSWTVDMLLIFTFQRKNILSFGDLAIHRGLQMLYGHSKISRELFAKYHKRYSPYATVASLYLWEIAGGQTVIGAQPARRKNTKGTRPAGK